MKRKINSDFGEQIKKVGQSPFMEVGKKKRGRPPGKSGPKYSYSAGGQKSAVPKAKMFKGSARGR
jgi:hypothetical protein